MDDDGEAHYEEEEEGLEGEEQLDEAGGEEPPPSPLPSEWNIVNWTAELSISEYIWSAWACWGPYIRDLCGYYYDDY